MPRLGSESLTTSRDECPILCLTERSSDGSQLSAFEPIAVRQESLETCAQSLAWLMLASLPTGYRRGINAQLESELFLAQSHPLTASHNPLTKGTGSPVTRIVAHKGDDTRQEAEFVRRVIELPIGDGGGVAPHPRGDLFLQQPQIEPTLAHMVTQRR